MKIFKGKGWEGGRKCTVATEVAGRLYDKGIFEFHSLCFAFLMSVFVTMEC